ncbi:MAG: hypothetical protein ACRD04_04490 [Terriglobales bacterium]
MSTRRRLAATPRERPSFEPKWAACEPAAGSLPVLPVAARAGTIVYSGRVNEIASLPDTNEVDFSLVAGGPSFSLSAASSSYSSGCSVGITIAEGTNAELESPLTALGPGATISGGDAFANVVEGLAGRYTGSSCNSSTGCTPNGGSFGPWPNNNQPYYAGLSLTQNGNTYYGWAEISAPAPTSTRIRFRRSCTATPTTTLPAPLVLFALGALGLLAFRKRLYPSDHTT